MKKLLALVAIIALSASAFGAGITCIWVNGDNPLATTNWTTIVFWGPSPGYYTNSITVPYSQTTVTITNLISGQRYCVAAQHSDGVDVSELCTEASAKTKLNPPKSINAVAQ